MKKRYHFGITLFFLLTLFRSVPLDAFGLTGHRVIAEIAQRHLTAKAKEHIRELIGNQQLAFWANWADFIKSDTTGRWKEASPWHYVDLPGHLSQPDFVQQLRADSAPNLYRQILACEATLRDRKASVQDRRYALYFLIHLVGDLHQPLHVGRAEDKGGNTINVQWFGKNSNLHRVWDEQLIDDQQYSYTEYATVLDVADAATYKTDTAGTLEDWFYESHLLADKVYDATPNGSNLRYDYSYKFINDLNSQLLKGGLRLAMILNELFG